MLRTMLTFLILSTAATAAETVSVLLDGHAEPIEGSLRQMTESRFFLQSDGPESTVTYEIGRSRILSVDGKDEIPESALGSTGLGDFSTFEKILPDGDVEVWSRHSSSTTRGPMTHVRYGAQERELPRIRESEVYDRFGNRLDIEIEPRADGLYTITIPLAVPIGPREELSLTHKTIRRGAAVKEGDVWSYTWNTDFPEDRIYTRKVQLPEGAEFVEASHHARPWSDVEPKTIYWRRYCPRLTDDLMTVKYRLAP